MGCLLYSAFLSLVLVIYISTATTHNQNSHHHPILPKITVSVPKPNHSLQRACEATRFPSQCLSSLSHFHSLHPKSLHIIQAAVAVSTTTLTAAEFAVNSLLFHHTTTNINRTNAVKTCLDVLHNSQYRISLAADALPRAGRIKDARAWMSAALAYQYDCFSGLKYVYGDDTASIADTLSQLEWLTGVSSNALSMMVAYDAFGHDTASWKPPRTERDGFWEEVGEEKTLSSSTKLGFNGGFPLNVKVDATVCKDGDDDDGEKCDFKTVQAAVDHAPANLGEGDRFVVRIKAGVYEETVKIPIHKRNVVFLGDGMGKTVISGSNHVGLPGITTYNSATVAVQGDGFMAKNLTIENTAGPEAHQAVAFRSDSDRSVLDSVEFIGNQDTLYAHSLRQFYKSCKIIGNVDFIFGNSASLFQDCDILVSPQEIESGETNAISAHGRTDPAESTGFVFYKCVVSGTPEFLTRYRKNPEAHRSYLGRPWKMYSRTVFVECELSEIVRPEGWLAWDGDVGLDTLYYGEYGNKGQAAHVTKRVSWSSNIPVDRVAVYSVSNFIQGNHWIPPYSQHDE